MPDNWQMNINKGLVGDRRFRAASNYAVDLLIISMFLVNSSGRNLIDGHRYELKCHFNDAAEASWIASGFPSAYLSDRPGFDLITPNFPKSRAASLHLRCGSPEVSLSPL